MLYLWLGIGYKDIYVKELAPSIVGAVKSKICKKVDKVETQTYFNLYLKQNLFRKLFEAFNLFRKPTHIFWGNCLTLNQSIINASQVALMVKNLPTNAGDIRDVGLIPGQEDPLEEGMTTHSSVLIWRIPWTEEPGRIQSTGSQRVGHNYMTCLAHRHIMDANY